MDDWADTLAVVLKLVLTFSGPATPLGGVGPAHLGDIRHICNAGIHVVIIRGYEYEINETANVANTTLRSQADDKVVDSIKDTIKTFPQSPPDANRLVVHMMLVTHKSPVH